MRKSAKLLLAPLLIAGAALAANPAFAAPNATGEEQLAKMLEGRQPGKPVSCISLNDSHDMVIIDGTAIVFGSGPVLYVNRPTDPSSLDSDKILVTKPTGDELCNVDIVTLRERTHMMMAGTVSLGDFVPYTRVPKAN